MKKRILSFMLAVIMIFGFITVLSIGSFAAYYYESESNDTYQTADYLPLNSTIWGNIYYDSKRYYYDQDYYKFELNSDSKVDIMFSHDKKDVEGTWAIYIYKYGEGGNLTQITYSKAYCCDGNYKFSSLGLHKGTYYVCVEYGNDGRDVLGLKYGITVNTSSASNWETEFNDSYTAADNLSLGVTKYGNIYYDSSCYYYDRDYYKFKLNSDSKVDIMFSHDKKDVEGAWAIYIYKYGEGGNLTQITYSKAYCCDGNYKFSSLGLHKGTYYIYINYGFDGSGVIGLKYGITVNTSSASNWETEFNDSYTDADNLSLGVTKYGNIYYDSSCYYYDRDYYKFELNSDSKVDITFSHDKKDVKGMWAIYIYKYSEGGNLTQITYSRVRCCDGNYNFNSLGLRKGTYYIYVEYGSDGSGVIGLKYGIKVSLRLDSPSNFKVTRRVKTKNDLSWSAVKGAQGYELQRYENGVWTSLGTTTATTFNDVGLTPGTYYKYKVRAYKNANGSLSYSDWVEIRTCTIPSKVGVASAKSNKSRQVTVKWKESVCTGYQIQYSTSSDFKGAKAVNAKKKTTTSKTISNLIGGRNYYIRIRAYKTIDGINYYGDWSKAKKVTIRR